MERDLKIESAPRRRRISKPKLIPFKRRAIEPYEVQPPHPNNPTRFPKRKAA